jgi:hypothetical protein
MLSSGIMTCGCSFIVVASASWDPACTIESPQRSFMTGEASARRDPRPGRSGALGASSVGPADARYSPATRLLPPRFASASIFLRHSGQIPWVNRASVRALRYASIWLQ